MMGYAHYASWRRPPNDDEWATFEQAAAVFLDCLQQLGSMGHNIGVARPIVLTGSEPEADHDPPTPIVVGRGVIRFNGYGISDGRDLSHETFRFSRLFNSSPDWNPMSEDTILTTVCHTDRKPYDLAVVGVLTLAYHLMPGCLMIWSSGGPADWEPGSKFLEGVFGVAFPVPDTLRERRTRQTATRLQ
jgi:hypothetical protein